MKRKKQDISEKGFDSEQRMQIDMAAVNRAIAEILSSPWVDVDIMSTALGVGRNVGYREATKGAFGAFKIGGRYRVPTAPLREALHLPSISANTAHAIYHNVFISANQSNAA